SCSRGALPTDYHRHRGPPERPRHYRVPCRGNLFQELDMTSQKWLIIAAALTMGSAHAASQAVTINQVNAAGKQASIGTIQISETEHGLLFTPQLSSLKPGQHGFHVHENGSCEPADKDGKPTAAQAAGGHYDPQQTGKHLGPYEDGHLGDLPAL